MSKKPKMRRVKKCDQCQQLRINGIVCHEIGCPNNRPSRQKYRPGLGYYHA